MHSWQTLLSLPSAPFRLDPDEKILCLGSCFSEVVARRLQQAGVTVLSNPFGPLYNPVSLSNALARLASAHPFTEGECVPLGAGDGRVGSFSHYTRLAQATAEAFLERANADLAEAAAFWRDCRSVVLTLGTAWCFRLRESGETVANCLKQPSERFERYRLGVRETSLLLQALLARYPDKRFIFSISPIRHLSDGAHANQLSKATLLLGLETAMQGASQAAYFPAYELLQDELRDYRYYAEDMIHPSAAAEDYIYERFTECFFSAEDRLRLERGTRAYRQRLHRGLQL